MKYQISKLKSLNTKYKYQISKLKIKNRNLETEMIPLLSNIKASPYLYYPLVVPAFAHIFPPLVGGTEGGG